MTADERATLDAMLRWGGSFIVQLATAYIAADPDNRKKIRDTWSDEWAKYQWLAKGAGDK